EFKKSYKCICDLFVEEDGYLQPQMGDLNWVEYLYLNKNKTNKAKIAYKNKEFYFSVRASLIDEQKQHYSIVFTDITKEELYKIELELISITDPLTNIKNRRYFQEKMHYEISRSKRYGYPVSFIMFDIDYFKVINDENGHDVGDEVLVVYTKFIASKLRESDIFCRIGGEEFMIIVPELDKDEAYKLAQKIREGVENYKKILPLTMSFGVVEYIDGESEQSLLKRVDKALYKAKDSGRNRVELG
ncbi:MAG: GGDEF domain-containing protein, partial [Campylobacterales bacterium]|nr:GGDEF domain-containing protein [Campylobacterales bacterium]